MKSKTYDEFVEKFKPKKTTDDCYTPSDVYDIILDFAINKNGWHDREVVRPFYPGGNYQEFEYPENCVVIDNPPFSIIRQIVEWYNEMNIDYFLFAPGLTFLNVPAPCHIASGTSIIYENGAKVNTGFVCSKGYLLETAPDLGERLKKCFNEKSRKIAKNHYPANFITAAQLNVLARNGIDFKASKGKRYTHLYNQNNEKIKVFGEGVQLDCKVPQITISDKKVTNYLHYGSE